MLDSSTLSYNGVVRSPLSSNGQDGGRNKNSLRTEDEDRGSLLPTRHSEVNIEEMSNEGKESGRSRSPQYENYQQPHHVAGNGSPFKDRTTVKQDSKLDLTEALRIRDIDAEMELARGINPELDSDRLRKLFLDSDRSTVTSHFSDWDNLDAVRVRCRQLEERVRQQRQDLGALRLEYRGICKKTEETQEEHFKVEALLRKTIAQEEQRLSTLQREGTRLLELEREATRQLATTLKDQQVRANRLESAMEACGQQMALALSAMVSFDVPGTTTTATSLGEENTDESSRTDDRRGSVSPVHSRDDRRLFNGDLAFSQPSDSFHENRTHTSSPTRRRSSSRISAHDGTTSHPTANAIQFRPPNPRRQRTTSQGRHRHRHHESYPNSLYQSMQSIAQSQNGHSVSSKSLPPPPSRPVDDDDVSRSLAALIPETLSALSEVLGPQSAKDVLLSPECYRQLLHTLTTTELSPTSAALLLANQHTKELDMNDAPGALWTASLTDANRRSRRAYSSSHQGRAGNVSESRSRRRERPPRVSHSTGPSVRPQSAAMIAHSLWERMKDLDFQMERIAEQHRKALQTTSLAELRKDLAAMACYLENLQEYHRDTIRSLQYPSGYHDDDDGFPLSQDGLLKADGLNGQKGPDQEQEIENIHAESQLLFDHKNEKKPHGSIRRKQTSNRRNRIQHNSSETAVVASQNDSAPHPALPLSFSQSSPAASQRNEPNLRHSAPPLSSSGSRGISRTPLLQTDDRKSGDVRPRQSEIALPHPPSFAQPTFASSISRQAVCPKPSMSSSSSLSNYSRTSSHPDATTKVTHARMLSLSTNPSPFITTTTPLEITIPTTMSQTTTASLTSSSQPTFTGSLEPNATKAPSTTTKSRSVRSHRRTEVRSVHSSVDVPPFTHETSSKKRQSARPRAGDPSTASVAPSLPSVPTAVHETTSSTSVVSTGMTKLKRKATDKQRVTEILPLRSPILSEGSTIDARTSPKFIKRSLLQDTTASPTQLDGLLSQNVGTTANCSGRRSPALPTTQQLFYEKTPPNSTHIASHTRQLAACSSDPRSAQTPLSCAHYSPLSHQLPLTIQNYSNPLSPGYVPPSIHSQSATSPIVRNTLYQALSPPRWIPYSPSGASTTTTKTSNLPMNTTTIPTAPSMTSTSSGILRQFPLTISSTVNHSLLPKHQHFSNS